MATTTGIRAGAAASDGRLALVHEAAWGTTPTSPAFDTMRLTTESLQPSKQTTRSNELRADRNIVDEILVGRSVAGDIGGELSFETYDDLLEALMHSEWTSGDVLKNGSGVGRSFSAERRVRLPDASFGYTRFNGLVANTMNLTVTAGEIATVSFGMMGRYGGTGTTALSGATYAAANQNRVMNATSHFADLSVSGVSSMAPVRSITLNATNNFRAQNAVGDLDVIGYAPGRFEVTGTLEAYFQDMDLLEAFLSHDDLSLEFTLGVPGDDGYRFFLPTIVLTGEPGGNLTGNDSDLMQSMNFTAVLDRITSEDAALVIEKVAVS